MTRFKRLKIAERLMSHCYLCGEKHKTYRSTSNLIAPRVSVFRCEFNDEDTGKDIALTWAFSNPDGKVVSLCDDCASYVLGVVAKGYHDGQAEFIVAPLEERR